MLVQVALIVGAALAYFAVRDLTEGSEATALANAERLISFERDLGIDIEVWLQGLIIERDWLVDLSNWIYIYGHWPVIGITMVWLFLRVPEDYRLLRNAMFLSGAIGLMVFASFPVAPPRFDVLDVADTVTRRSDSYRTLQPPGLINRYAAMPSLHFGWNLLVGVVLWKISALRVSGVVGRRVLRVAAVAMPAAMAFAVVVTGNHYVIDVIAGGLVALIGFAVAMLVQPTSRDSAHDEAVA